MADTEPRELTAAELALVQAPAQRAPESSPLPVPPGTQVPVHLLNPAAETAAAEGAPTAGPPEAPVSAAGASP